MLKRSLLLLLALVSVPAAYSQAPVPAPDWKPLQFLMGNWVAEGGGGAGQGSGSFSFQLDLAQRVLVRRNVADYPAQNGHPAAHHEDLMMIFPGSDGKLRATFYDSEGHVINYTVEPGADGQGVIFTGDLLPGAPRFRLSYTTAGDNLTGRFEIAPPGKPEAFADYLKWTAHRAPTAHKD